MTEQEQAKRKRTRSPAYPFINLETALTRAKQFYDNEQRNAANITVATKHWGFVEDSSNGAQTIAALISFGLLQDEGSGERRTVKLTQDALRILLDTRPDSSERAELIRKCALSPKIHKQLWERWGTGLPSDANLRHTLLFDWETPFNENAVDTFIAEYKSTIAFARLSESDKIEKEEVEDGENVTDNAIYVPKVNDYVQWEHNGVLGFPNPKRVREITPDGQYVYVDGQNGAVLAAELIKEEAPEEKPILASFPAAEQSKTPPNKSMQEFVVPLADGAKAIFQWPLVLTPEDVEDLKDTLKSLEKKITRQHRQNSVEPAES